MHSLYFQIFNPLPILDSIRPAMENLPVDVIRRTVQVSLVGFRLWKGSKSQFHAKHIHIRLPWFVYNFANPFFLRGYNFHLFLFPVFFHVSIRRQCSLDNSVEQSSTYTQEMSDDSIGAKRYRPT